jgi:hypothetical protein
MLAGGGGRGLAALGIEAPVQPRGLVFSLDLEPSQPQAGEALRLTLVADLRGASLVSYRLAKGLLFDASSSRALVSESGERRTEITLDLRAEAGGRLRVEELRIEGEEGRYSVGPFSIEVAGGARAREAEATWVWDFPGRVWRYESFPVSLRASGPVPAGAWPSFRLPDGLLLEAGADDFSWMATALKAGRMELPPVEIRSGQPARAEASAFEVLDLPVAVSASRAIGAFSLALEGGSAALVGATYSAKVVLSGEGNFPSLVLPAPRLNLAGVGLSPSAWKQARSDALARTATGYRGSATLEIHVIPRKTGLLAISLPTFTFMARDGSLHELRAPALELRVREAGVAPDRGPGAAVSRLQTLVASGRNPRFLEASRALKAGEPAKALAILLSEARNRDRSLRREAALLASELGAEPPDFGALPPSSFLFAAAPLLLLLSLLSVILLRGRSRSGRGGSKALRGVRGGLFIALGFAVLALLSLGLGFAAFGDETAPRALTWSERLYTIPSLGSELTLELVPGRSGRRVGAVSGWVCLSFRDGSTGWLPAESLYWY